MWDAEGVEITIVDRIEVGMWSKEVSNFEQFRRRCLLSQRCNRLITTRRLQWSHCHCFWRSGRVPSAIVDQFGVAIGVAKRKVIQNN
jgi:hypothetical protein